MNHLNSKNDHFPFSSSLPLKYPFLRKVEDIMHPKRMGAMHQTNISFTRSIIRKMAKEKWVITNTLWNLNRKGFGEVIYQWKTPHHVYSMVIFCDPIKDEERSDRVIAEKWDVTFALVEGTVKRGDDFFKLLKKNVPLQEAGRTNQRVLVLSRANKSVRIFNHIVKSLAVGEQPDIELLLEVGYILRTTAVYGNGKFSIADFHQLKKTSDFELSFSAQMCAVYTLRHFSLDLIHYLAKMKNPKAIKLDDNLQTYLGVGNATGLGMAPYLVKHPLVVDNWMTQREFALTSCLSQSVNEKKLNELIKKLERAEIYFTQVVTGDHEQIKRNQKAVKEIEKIIKKFKSIKLEKSIWLEFLQLVKPFSYEVQEAFIACLMEVYPNKTGKYVERMNCKEEAGDISTVTLKQLLEVIKEKYNWCLKIDFSKPESNHLYWYASATKEEPRLGLRKEKYKGDPEQPLDIARQVSNLHQNLITYIEKNKIKNSKPPINQSVSEFLFHFPGSRSIVKRVWQVGSCWLGEIQVNSIHKDFLPIDYLRAKLSIFGATKFDPRSDRWVQVTFFQNTLRFQDWQTKKDVESFFPILKYTR